MERVSIDATDLKGRTLTVSTWGGGWTDSLKKNLFEPYEKDTGVKVEYVVSGNDVTAPVFLQESQKRIKIDLVDAGDSGALQAAGYLERFPDDLVASLTETSRPETVNNPYVLGYASVATVIVCNMALVDRCPATPEQFWDVDAFPGDRAMPAEASSAIPNALLADGVAGDRLFPLDLDRAFAKLGEIKPKIKVWTGSGDQQLQTLLNKEVGMAYVWSTRLPTLRKELPRLTVSWDQATVSAGGGWTVPKGSPNADVAFNFLNWMGRHPQNQARVTEEFGAVTPTKELAQLLPGDASVDLPSEHSPIPVPYLDLAKQSKEVQRAWQQFIAG